MGVKNRKHNTIRQTGDRNGLCDETFILANRRNRRQAKKLGLLGELETRKAGSAKPVKTRHAEG